MRKDLVESLHLARSVQHWHGIAALDDRRPGDRKNCCLSPTEGNLKQGRTMCCRVLADVAFGELLVGGGRAERRLPGTRQQWHRLPA